jgi:hypothetical protein
MTWWAWLLDGFCAGAFFVGTIVFLAARSRP